MPQTSTVNSTTEYYSMESIFQRSLFDLLRATSQLHSRNPGTPDEVSVFVCTTRPTTLLCLQLRSWVCDCNSRTSHILGLAVQPRLVHIMQHARHKTRGLAGEVVKLGSFQHSHPSSFPGWLSWGLRAAAGRPPQQHRWRAAHCMAAS